MTTSWFNRFIPARFLPDSGRVLPPPPDPGRIHEMIQEGSLGRFHYRTPTFFRTGKWVMTSEGIGIITDLSNMNFATVMLTNDMGADFRLNTFPIGQIRLAHLSEIPAPRRPDRVKGIELGYF